MESQALIIHQQKSQYDDKPQDIAGYHDPFSAGAIDDDACYRGHEKDGEQFGHHGRGHRHPGATELKNQGIDGDGVQPVAKLRNHLPVPQVAEGPIGFQ